MEEEDLMNTESFWEKCSVFFNFDGFEFDAVFIREKFSFFL